MTSIYRRLLHDDSRGVGEVLNETVCVLDRCEGLTVSICYEPIFTSSYYFHGSWFWIRGFWKIEIQMLSWCDISFSDPRKVLSQNWSTGRRCQVASNIWPRDIFPSSVSLHRAGLIKFWCWHCYLRLHCLADQFSVLQDGSNEINFPLPTFSGIDPSYSLPNNVAVITLQVSKKKFLLKISPNKLLVMPWEKKRTHSLRFFSIT